MVGEVAMRVELHWAEVRPAALLAVLVVAVPVAATAVAGSYGEEPEWT